MFAHYLESSPISAVLSEASEFSKTSLMNVADHCV